MKLFGLIALALTAVFLGLTYLPAAEEPAEPEQPTSNAKCTVSITDLSQAEQRAVAFALARQNAERVKHKLAPFPDANAWMADHILSSRLPSWQAQEKDYWLAQTRAKLKTDLTLEQRAAIESVIGITQDD